jgi:hypothetical protein
MKRWTGNTHDGNILISLLRHDFLFFQDDVLSNHVILL